jgi:hypothetical protein
MKAEFVLMFILSGAEFLFTKKGMSMMAGSILLELDAE